jgi:hypothetical protein
MKETWAESAAAAARQHRDYFIEAIREEMKRRRALSAPQERNDG